MIPYTLRCGRVVVDEHCACGGLRSQHTPHTFILNGGDSVDIEGHGECAATGCAKFAWRGFIYRQQDSEPALHSPDTEGED